MHVLVRNAVYDAMPKELRAHLHERLAEGLDREGELLGYHLEQAYRLHAELGPPDAHAQAVARKASEVLASGGRKAILRGDAHAAANLLSRSVGLCPKDDPLRVERLFDLADSLEETDELDRALEMVVEAGVNAEDHGDARLVALAGVRQVYLRVQVDAEFSFESALRVAKRSEAILDSFGDVEGLARALGTAAWLSVNLGTGDGVEETFTRAIELARRAENRYLESWILVNWTGVLAGGIVPLTKACAIFEGLLDRGEEMPRLRMYVCAFLAPLRALQGRFDEARDLQFQARAMAEEMGRTNCLAWLPRMEAEVELLAGNARAAEQKARRAASFGQDLGARAGGLLNLGEALYRQGRLDEAADALSQTAEICSPDDVGFQAWRRSLLAKVTAARGCRARAEELVREATAFPIGHDCMWSCAVLLDCAETLRLLGRPDEAIPYVEQAIEIYDRKEATYPAARARELLAELTRAR